MDDDKEWLRRTLPAFTRESHARKWLHRGPQTRRGGRLRRGDRPLELQVEAAAGRRRRAAGAWVGWRAAG